MNKFRKISMDEYKLIPALSSHDLMTVIKHPTDWPKYLFEGYHDPVDEKLQAIFDVGTLFHTMVLEPELLDKEYIRTDSLVDRPDYIEGKKIIYVNANRSIFKAADYSFVDLSLTAKETFENESSRSILACLDKAEYSTDYKCPSTGLYFRGRPDAILKDGSVVDLKTAKRNDPKSFQYAINNYNYDMQAAFYCDICDTKDFYWIACSLKTHTVEVYKATDKQLATGWEKNEYAKQQILRYLNDEIRKDK